MGTEKITNAPVSAVPCPSYGKEAVQSALARAIEEAGGLPADPRGMRIGIKANLVSAMKPEEAATTHPALLAALVSYLLARGAREVVVGDSPGGLYTPAFVHRVYRAAGLDAVTAVGGLLNEDFSQKSTTAPDAAVLKSFTYTGWIDTCDLLINFCKLKSHGMMGMSNAVKNLFGVIPGTMKPEYHFRFPEQEAFADMIVDLAEFVKPAFSICDAIVGMEGNGPTKGVPRQIGAILASRDPHALDLVAARLIGLRVSEVPTLAAAVSRLLIPADPDALTVVGDLAALCLSDFKTVAVRRSLRFSGSGKWYSRAFSAVAGKVLSSRPILRGGCISCKKCHEVCPAKAIAMKDGKPVIDRKKCIRCFCCQEFCPVGAMQVYRTPIARLLTK